MRKADYLSMLIYSQIALLVHSSTYEENPERLLRAVSTYTYRHNGMTKRSETLFSSKLSSFLHRHRLQHNNFLQESRGK